MTNQFVIPPDDTVIWRYMDYWKYEQMIQKRSLHFTRLNVFDDLLEGTLSPSHLRAIGERHPEHCESLKEEFETFKDEGYRSVTCWYIGDYESNLLWKTYTTSPCSLAIRSSVARLRDSLPRSPAISSTQSEPRDSLLPFIPIKRVLYMDFDQNITDNENFILQDSAWFHKSLEYTLENELRACVTGVASFNPPETSQRIRTSHGWNIPINFVQLIDKVIIHPCAESCFENCLKHLHSDNGLPEDLILHSSICTSINNIDSYSTDEKQ